MSEEQVSDDRSNLPDLPAPGTGLEQKVKEIPVAVFEGEYVREMTGRLPAVELGMSVGYARNTHLLLQVMVRVQGVGVDETREGELIRRHKLVLADEPRVVGVYTAEQVDQVNLNGDLEEEEQDDPDGRPEHGEEDGHDVGF